MCYKELNRWKTKDMQEKIRILNIRLVMCQKKRKKKKTERSHVGKGFFRLYERHKSPGSGIAMNPKQEK